MASAEERLVKSTRQISRLYYDHIDINEVIELMRDQDISSKLVEGIYYQLSKDADKSMTERFYYYSVEVGIDDYIHRVGYWTSRYLFTYRNKSIDPTFHKIEITDLFNNKTM
jgi:hypothetical protein